MADRGNNNFLPQAVSEEEQFQRLENQTKGNVVFNISWWVLAAYLLLMGSSENWGVHVKTIVVIRILMRLFYSCPTRICLYYLAKKKVISAGSVHIFTAIIATPLFGWYIYVVYSFFSSSNDCRAKTTYLHAVFLLLMIESCIYLLFFLLICCVIGLIGCLTCAMICIKAKEKLQNEKIKSVLMKCKGLQLSLDELAGDNTCCICWTDYTEESKILKLPCNQLHYFHAECIGEWIQKKSNWPLCKTEISIDTLKPFKKKRVVNSERERIIDSEIQGS